MRTKLRDIYRSVFWLGLAGVVVLPAIIVTQPASFSDGLLLSVVLTSSFFVVLLLITSCGVWVRQRQELHRGESYVVGTSLRQGLLAGSLVVVLLVLQLLRVVTVVDAALFIGLVIMIELYLASRAEARR